MEILGIDIGGSGIKGAPIDTKNGSLLADRYRIATPSPATPARVARVISEILVHFNWKGPIGCGFPAAIQHGVAQTASNIDKAWVGTNVEQLFTNQTGMSTIVLNDADAAGLAEVYFGAGKGVEGLVFMVTVGTGLGTALITDGKLVPNTELGHIKIKKGIVAEPYASDATKKKLDLSWKQWAKRFEDYLQEIEKLFFPDLILVGGGTSKRFEKFVDHLDIKTPIRPAQLLNNAGMIGAAKAAELKIIRKQTAGLREERPLS
ncbi:MAG: ROK family protein [Bacteroidota bacterium]